MYSTEERPRHADTTISVGKFIVLLYYRLTKIQHKVEGKCYEKENCVYWSRFKGQHGWCQSKAIGGHNG